MNRCRTSTVRAAVAAVCLLLVTVATSLGASHRTTNFIVSAATPELAKEIAVVAERYRGQLAEEWLGGDIAHWDEPCPIVAEIGPDLRPSGETSYALYGRRPVAWQMRIRGPRGAVLDSVLPHEITHTLFATHFGRPLPRWAEEGACVTVEHRREKVKLDRILPIHLTRGQGFHLEELFSMEDYPPNVLPLYAQSYSVVCFLIQQGGKQKFVQFVGDGMDSRNWQIATHKHYGYEDLSQLHDAWYQWATTLPDVTDPTRVVSSSSSP